MTHRPAQAQPGQHRLVEAEDREVLLVQEPQHFFEVHIVEASDVDDLALPLTADVPAKVDC